MHHIRWCLAYTSPASFVLARLLSRFTFKQANLRMKDTQEGAGKQARHCACILQPLLHHPLCTDTRNEVFSPRPRGRKGEMRQKERRQEVETKHPPSCFHPKEEVKQFFSSPKRIPGWTISDSRFAIPFCLSRMQGTGMMSMSIRRFHRCRLWVRGRRFADIS